MSCNGTRLVALLFPRFPQSCASAWKVKCSDCAHQFPAKIMTKKKQTREERLEKKKIAERKRKAKIKNDPEKAEELRKVERERYHRKRRENKILLLSQMTPRERRRAQKTKKIINKAYYERQKRKKMLDENSKKSTSSLPGPSIAFQDVQVQLNTSPPRMSRIDAPNVSPMSVRRRKCLECKSPDAPKRYSHRIMTRSINVDSANMTPHAKSSKLGSSRNLLTSSPIPTFNDSPPASPCISSIHSGRSSPSCNSPVSDTSVSSSIVTKDFMQTFRKYKYQKAKETKLLQKRIMELRKEKDSYRKRAERAEKIIKMEKSNVTRSRPASPPKNVTISGVQADKSKRLRNAVINFLEDDEHSRISPGKNDFITRHKQKKQKRYLCDYLKNLHGKYISSGLPPVSYTTFCRMRPFWIRQPDLSTRNTCLCQIHANIELIITALKNNKIIHENCSTDVLESLCCDKGNVKCLMRQCELCKNRQILYREFDNSSTMTYWIWEKVSKTYMKDNEQKFTKAVEKVKHQEKPLKVINIFESLLKNFLIHCGHIKNQYNSIKHIKNSMSENECLVHIDYSENYSTKYGEEIQSVHFGGSRSQVTLHTAVIYYHHQGQSKTQAFCTLSSSLRHDAPAVWAHMVPILTEIEKLAPHVTTLHIVSDSPSAQYRNKKIFHIISQLSCYCPSVTGIVWHYCECGHGKGAPDGVGGVLKRMADQHVAYGNDIININSLIHYLQSSVKAVKMEEVEDYQITEKDWLIPKELKSFPGTMKVHQAVWSKQLPQVIALRSLSCIKPQCLNTFIECPHGYHLGFYELSISTNKINNPPRYNEPFLSVPMPTEKPLHRQTTKVVGQKNQIPSIRQVQERFVKDQTTLIQNIQVTRFKASESFLLKSKKKKIPCTITSKDLATDIQDNLNSTFLSKYDLNMDSEIENIVPNCSYFENISSPTFSKFENAKTQKEQNNNDQQTRDMDSDLDIF